MNIMTLEQVYEAAVKMEIGSNRVFSLDKEPEKFQMVSLCTKLTNIGIPAEKCFLIRRSEKTLHIICYSSKNETFSIH